MRKTRLLCDLTFLLRCRDNNIIPTFCKVNHHTHNLRIHNILKRTSQALLRETIRRTRKNLDTTDRQVLTLHIQLSNVIHITLWTKIDKLTHFISINEEHQKTNRHKKKFEHLNNKKPQTKTQITHNQNIQTVHNLSNTQLDQGAISVLQKGFNFAVTPTKIPTEDIICAIESATSHLDKNTAEIVRQDTARILRKAKPPKPNLNTEERKALHILKQNDSIMILPADKGNATVVMNTEDYRKKMSLLLEDPAYKPITTDPTTYLEKTTKAKIKATPIDAEIQKAIAPREKSSKCPKLYGLPKIHKDDIPLRPIVSSVGSPTQQLARYLAQQLQPATENIKSYVKNSRHFLEIVKDIKLAEEDILVSFDVKSLFTQIPMKETIEIIQQQLKPEPHIITLLKHCLDNTYFIYNGQRYRQTEGAPMGSPLSPIIANIYMDNFENKALSTAPKAPKLWLRYVDDTFVIWPHGEEELKNFLEHLNNIHERIQFTMEIEQNNSLPFLDVLMIKNPNGTISHTVYRKTTHTNRYLHAHSHHHPAQLNSVLKTLTYRSKQLTDNEHTREEMENLRQSFIKNGFTNRQIDKVFNIKEKETKKQDEPQQKTILPYIKGTTDKISKIMTKHNIRTIFTTQRKISEILRKPKDKIPLEEQGIYEIPCKNCDRSYIGQSNRRINARREEHKNAVNKLEPTSSLVQHIKQTGHTIDFDNTRTIAEIKYFQKRVLREAIEIEKRPTCLNKRDDSHRLEPTWKVLLHTGNNPEKTRLTRTSDGKNKQGNKTHKNKNPGIESNPQVYIGVEARVLRSSAKIVS